MFILNHKDVEHCQVSQNKYSQPTICYRGFIFNKVWNTKDIQVALKLCREFLDLDKPVTSILVKNNGSITIWAEAEQVNSINHRASCCSAST